MSKKKGRRLAFAVSDYDEIGVDEYGHSVWLRATSPTTLVKTSGEDIYIGAHAGMGTFKISLHGGRSGMPEAWQLGQTKEHRESGNEPMWVGRSRLSHTWTPTPFVDGIRTALIWDTYRGALCASTFDHEAFQLKYPKAGGYVRLIIAITESGLDFTGCEGQVTRDPLPLASGRKVWFAWQAVTEAVPDEVYPAQGAIMMPDVLDVDGIDVPHIRIRGGNFDFELFRNYRPSCPWPALEPVHLRS